MKKKYFLLLLLLPVFFVLHNYNDIFGFISFIQIITFFLFTGIFTGLLYLLVYVTTRNRLAAILITFNTLLWVLLFGPLHDFLKSAFPGSVISSYKMVVPVSLLLLLVLSFFIVRKKTFSTRYARFLLVLMNILCLWEIAGAGFNLFQLLKDDNLLYPSAPVCDQYTSCQLPDSSKPDIYYIVVDEYTDNHSLKTLWNFDNHDFTGWLTQKGFQVLPRSHSNYNSTVFSVSSVFNMNYIPRENGNKGTPLNNLKGTKSLSNNETFCLLQKEGYTIRFLAPFRNSIEENGLIDYFDYMHNNRLYHSTLPGRFQKDILWNFQSGRFSFLQKDTTHPFRNRINDVQHTIDQLKETAGHSVNNKPKFVYGHLLVTHEPHFFDSSGNLLKGAQENTVVNPFDTYTRQVLYTNKLIKDIVSHILARNKKNTVIIIQGDHGYRNLPKEFASYNFTVLNAIYFPDSNYAALDSNFSLVNTFRTVFNKYFCQRLPLLKHTSTLVIDYE